MSASNELAKTNQDAIGFALGGDANCSASKWSTAVWECQSKIWKEGSCPLKGLNTKPGDVIVAMGSNLTIFENNCDTKGREDQHDPMYFHCRWKGWTEPQRVLQSSGSNEVQFQIRKTRPQLALESVNHPVPY